MSSNRSHSLIYIGGIALMIGISVFFVNTCDNDGPSTWPPTPRKGYVGTWEPQWLSPVQKNPLPSVSVLLQTLEQSNGTVTKRNSTNKFYTVVLSDPKKQHDFSVKQTKKKTLGGQRVWFTDVEFQYTDTNMGTYILQWEWRGRHKPEFLKLDGQPREFILSLDGVKEWGKGPPVLEILGVEGCGPNERAVLP